MDLSVFLLVSLVKLLAPRSAAGFTCLSSSRGRGSRGCRISIIGQYGRKAVTERSGRLRDAFFGWTSGQEDRAWPVDRAVETSCPAHQPGWFRGEGSRLAYRAAGSSWSSISR